MKEASQIPRTRLGELMFNKLAGIPLTAECVFYSPKYLKGTIEKEVCDFLLVLKGQAVLVSMKAQEDPTAHIGERLERWSIKSADKAIKQAQGAVRTIREKPFWCDHSRRGRVVFEANSLNVIHAVVITEVIGQTVELPGSFPLSIGSIPVSYFSVNDFGNLVNELRAFYDIDAYLQERSSMPDKTQRTIGDEVPLYKYYILNKQSFDGCLGYEDARIVVASKESDWDVEMTFRPLKNMFAGLIESVSNELATRRPNYTEGLRDEVIARYDNPESRKNYLLMQEELCDLRLIERQALGMQFNRLIDKVRLDKRPANMAYGLGYLNSKPDFVYVFVSAKKISAPIIIDRSTALLHGAMTQYKKTRGMIIADRDGEGFEVAAMSNFSPLPIDFDCAKQWFAHLRIDDIELS